MLKKIIYASTLLSMIPILGCNTTPRFMTTTESSYTDTYNEIRKSLSPSDLKKFDTAIEIIRIRPDKIYEGDYEMLQDLDGLDYQGTIEKAKSYANENIATLSGEYEKYKSESKELNKFKVSCGQNVTSMNEFNNYIYENNTNKKVSKCKVVIQAVNKETGKITDRGESDFDFEENMLPNETRKTIGVMVSSNNISIDTKYSTIKFMTKELYDEKGNLFASTDWTSEKLNYLQSFKAMVKNL